MRLGKSILFALFLLTGTLGYSQQTIFINEILAGNENDIWDEFSQHEDWLEIYYQAGSSPALVNLAGYYLSDDPDSLTKWQIPDTNQGLTTVPQGQHIVFFIDKDPNQGENHVDFKLSLDGETVTLTEPDGVTIVDQITYPMMVDDISYGRSSDGADDWVFFNNTTPDDPNAQGEFVPEVLFINEVMTNNTSNIYDEMDEHEQWVEIYNPNPYQVNLAGYHFTTTDGDSPVFEIPDTDPLLTVIPAEGFLVFWFDGETADGENHVSFSLEEGGNVQLTGQFVSNVIDSYDYPVLAENESWGRQTDGSGTSISFSIPTPRVTNSLVIVEPEELYINEVMADNFSDTVDNYMEAEDWIEIYNPNPYPVNLAGYFLSDNPNNPMKFQIALDNPDSTTVGANDWILFWADEDGDQGCRHISFRLYDQGEEVRLFSPDGFTLADECEFGVLMNDQTYGRLTDGNTPWVTFIEPTPEASNNGSTIGIEENTMKIEELKVYPNPSLSGELVRFSEWTKFQVWDLNGRLIHDWTRSNFLNTSNFEAGVYLLKSDDGRVARLILE